MTPRFHSVEMALNAADALLPYRRHRGSKYLNNLTGLVQAEKTWDRFKETYVSICVAGGWDGDRVASRLRSWENANKSHREKLLEKLNRRRMATEELLQRQWIREERRLQNRDLKAMAKEDRRSCRARDHEDAYERRAVQR